MDTNPTKRLEELRTELRAERISYGELLELQSLAKYIDPSDTELLEAAGVPEHVMSMKSGDQYVAASGRCPRCDSDNIQAVENFDPGSQGMEIDCGACGLQYFDAYTLTGYYIVNGAGVDEYNATPLGRPITDAQRDTILAALRLLDELCNVINPIPGETPTVVISVRGGIVEEVTASITARVIIIDHDNDGVPDDCQHFIDGDYATITTNNLTPDYDKVSEYEAIVGD